MVSSAYDLCVRVKISKGSMFLVYKTFTSGLDLFVTGTRGQSDKNVIKQLTEKSQSHFKKTQISLKVIISKLTCFLQ